MFKEFKEFISKGNVMDMAVGLVTGSAFTAIVTSLVNDVISPLIGILVGGLDFADLKWVIKEAVLDAEGAVATPEVAVKYGAFIQAIINFLIVAFVIFLVVKGMNKMREAAEKLAKKNEEEAAPEAAPEEPAAPAEDIVLLTEIRDLLKEQNSK